MLNYLRFQLAYCSGSLDVYLTYQSNIKRISESLCTGTFLIKHTLVLRHRKAKLSCSSRYQWGCGYADTIQKSNWLTLLRGAVWVAVACPVLLHLCKLLFNPISYEILCSSWFWLNQCCICYLLHICRWKGGEVPEQCQDGCRVAY